MQSSDSPSLFPVPFANTGVKSEIPTESSGVPGQASLQTGFPPETMTPVSSGGIPPAGADFNGILNQVSAGVRWSQAGGTYKFNAVFASSIGGYPRGSLLSSADGTVLWLSSVENNLTDPDSVGASGWINLMDSEAVQEAVAEAQGYAAVASTEADRSEAAANIAMQYSDTVPYKTRALMEADTSRPNNTKAWVWGDTAANNGLYVYSTTTSTWSRAEESAQPASQAEVEATASEVNTLQYRTGQIVRYSVPGFSQALVRPEAGDVGRLVQGVTDSGVSVMAQAEVIGDLRAPGIPAQYPRIAGKSYVEATRPDSSGQRRMLGYITDAGAGYKWLFGRGMTKLFDPADIESLNSRVSTLESGGVGVGHGGLGRLADCLSNALTDVNATFAGDSIVWGRTLAGQVTQPLSHTLATKRDVLTTPSWVNLLRNYLGHTFLNVPNDVGATVEDAPGATPGDGGSGYFSEVRSADLHVDSHVTLRDSSGMKVVRSGSIVSGASVPAPLSVPAGYAVEFEVFGASFDLLYGTADGSGSFQVLVDGAPAATQEFGGGVTWSNVLTIALSPGWRSIRVVNQASIELRLESVRREKVIRIVNQGIIGTATTTWAPTGVVLPNCLRADSNFCLVALGTNDRGLSNTPQNESGYRERLGLVVDYLISEEQDVILLTNGATTNDYPWNTGGTGYYMSMGDVARVNRDVAASMGLSHIDIYTITRQLQLDGDVSWLADGLHPNEKGHRDYWFAEVRRRILAAWEA